MQLEKLTDTEMAALRRSYLFSGMDDAECADVSPYCSVLKLEPGTVLFAQNTPVTAIYWLKEGLIRLTRSSSQGDEKVIELVGPGRFFAEATVFMGGGYPVNAVAQVPTRVVQIDAPHLKAWLAADTQRCFRMLAGISMRMHKLISEIDQLTLMKGSDRLLQYLIDHSEPDADGQTIVQFVAPKQVIASRIGIKPETLSRLLHKLTDLGLIRMEGQKVWILSEDGMSNAIGKAAL